ncbi:hypothetical protein BKA83DRAFT_676286, partial [Pisolithus microcarpus]
RESLLNHELPFIYTSARVQPDNKARRYDRQLRLWAATGQCALESSRVLVLSGSATSTSILKNLVLPGIGHFTILDHATTSHADAGNNFFLEGLESVGKPRASEAVRLLRELNDSVDGHADTRQLRSVIESNPDWLASFTVVIAHNLDSQILTKLSSLLWEHPSHPTLIVVRSAGFLAEFFIQVYEHTIIESHSETPPPLRIDKPFPALKEHALSLDFASMDPTEHGHIPYVVILVRLLEDWKRSVMRQHDGNPPRTYSERQEFKKSILALKVKPDEENFDEAEAQAYRCWTETTVPPEIASLFDDTAISPEALRESHSPFFHLLAALKEFTDQSETHTLPLTSTLPDMKADTTNYIHLQKLYKTRADEEKTCLQEPFAGTRWDALDRTALVNALAENPKAACLHLSLSALSTLKDQSPDLPISTEALRKQVISIIGDEAELPECLDDFIGEVVRAPSAELPTTAAFLGGMIAQETIKIITKQYVPVRGYCTIDLIETWTAVIGS